MDRSISSLKKQKLLNNNLQSLIRPRKNFHLRLSTGLASKASRATGSLFFNFLFSAAHAVLHGGGAVLAGDDAAPLELAVAVLIFGQRLRLVLPLAAHVIAVLRSVRGRRGVAVPVGFKLLV